MRFVVAGVCVILLAACGATPEAQERQQQQQPAALPKATAIKVSSTFRAEIYARGLNHPTAMAFGPDGRLYVSQDVGSVVRVGPGTRKPKVMTKGIPVPLGLAWIGQRLYISAQGRVVRRTLANGKLGSPHVVVSGLPYGRHQQDNIVVGPDGNLYFGSGSTCDVCNESNKRSATILTMKPNGSNLHVHARGLRNAYGLAFRPGTSRLFATVNGRDDLGTNEPAEMLVRVKKNARYGWPSCWPSWQQKRMRGTSCAGVTRPIAYLETHSSADGVAFVTGSAFPSKWKNGAFVALWGQYNSTARGRRVVFVNLSTGKPSTFASGFEHPLAIAFDSKGAMLVADWGRGVIYRIQRKGKP